MLKQNWKVVTLSVAGGILGVLLALGGSHLWQDHADHHAMMAWVIQVQQAQAKAAAQQQPGK